MVRASAGDRIILFTLVDLLLQIIFFAFLLFAVNRASQGAIQDRLAALAQRFGVFSVTRFLDATSKLVAISELGRVDVVPASDRSKPLDDATKVIEGLDRESLRQLSRLDAQQLRTFARVVAGLSPAERTDLTGFIRRYGTAFVRPAVESGLTREQMRRLLSTVSRLPAKDRSNLIRLSVMFANADPNKRQKIVDASAAIAKPICFAGSPALEITEVPGGYRVTTLLPNLAGEVAGHGASGGTVVLGPAAFEHFGSAFDAAHPDCTIRVRQRSETNDESQFKTIQRYFLTF